MTFSPTLLMQNLAFGAGALTFSYLAMESRYNMRIANSASNAVTRLCAEKRKKHFASPWYDNPWNVFQWLRYYGDGFVRAIGMAEQYDCDLMQEYCPFLGGQFRKSGSKFPVGKILLRLGTIVASAALSVEFELQGMRFFIVPLVLPGMVAFDYFAFKDHQNDMKFCHGIVKVVNQYESRMGRETLSETIERRIKEQESSST